MEEERWRNSSLPLYPTPMCKPVRNSVVMVYKHHKGPIRYSLYSLPLPFEEEEEEEVVGGGFNQQRRRRRRRRNPCTVTLLEFSSKEYPIGMGFTFMENLNRLYMMGGQFLDRDGDVCTSRKVFSVDLTTPAMADDGDSCTSREDFIADDGDSCTTSQEDFIDDDGDSCTSQEDFIDILPLSVCDSPRMRSGKGNPIVINAYDKIYVLASACICDDDPRPLGPPPFGFDKDDMTLVVDEELSDDELDKVILFEVFDPLTEQWTALSGPDSEHYSTSRDNATHILGHAVVNELILLTTTYNDAMFLVFHITKQVWSYFDRNDPRDIDPYLDYRLLLNLEKDGFMGGGVVVDENTLYVFNTDNELAAHHIAIEDFDVSWFLGQVGVNCPCSLKFESTGGLMLFGRHLVYLGQDKLCCVSCDYPTVFDPEKAVGACIRIFSVNKERCSCGTNSRRANVIDSYALEGVDTKLGSILYCFALYGKIPNFSSWSKEAFGWQSTWRKIQQRGSLGATIIAIGGFAVCMTTYSRHRNLLKL